MSKMQCTAPRCNENDLNLTECMVSERVMKVASSLLVLELYNVVGCKQVGSPSSLLRCQVQLQLEFLLDGRWCAYVAILHLSWSSVFCTKAYSTSILPIWFTEMKIAYVRRRAHLVRCISQGLYLDFTKLYSFRSGLEVVLECDMSIVRVRPGGQVLVAHLRQLRSVEHVGDALLAGGEEHHCEYCAREAEEHQHEKEHFACASATGRSAADVVDGSVERRSGQFARVGAPARWHCLLAQPRRQPTWAVRPRQNDGTSDW